VHSSMVKRGGNVKIEAYKVIAMVFLVEEWYVPVYGIFFLYCLRGRFHWLAQPYLCSVTALFHSISTFSFFSVGRMYIRKCHKIWLGILQGWTGRRPSSDVLLQAALWRQSKNSSSSWAVCGE
jgi:hypothetical protein